jgi:uncharacterized cupin superfamily protein
VTVQHHTRQAAVLDAAQVLRGPLPEEISMAPVRSGVPVAHEKTITDDADGRYAVWACGAGVFPRVKDKRGSFMYIISGDASIVDQDGTSHELTAGSALVLPFGWRGAWHIRETIRKVYLHTTPVPPLPTAVVPCAFGSADQVGADVPGAAAAPGSPAAADTVVFDGPDGRCDIRTRAAGQYAWAPDEHGFFAVVLAGGGFLTDDDGTLHELTPGTALALPGGWSGTWDIRQALRMFCVSATPAQPAPPGAPALPPLPA